MYPLLWSTILIPAVFMPIVYLIGRRIGNRVGWIALIPMLYSLLVLLLYTPMIMGGDVYVERFEWVPKVYFGVLLDGVSLPVCLTISLVSLLVILYSIPYMGYELREGFGTYYAIYLIYVASMLGVALSTNLFEFYFFFELMIIPPWALINLYGYRNRRRVALTFLLWSIAGAVVLSVGLMGAYNYIGSFEIADLSKLGGEARWIMIALLLGFLIKLGAFGFHLWLPDTYSEAPTPIAALLSSAMTGLAAYGMVRLMTPIHQYLVEVGWLILIWGFVTMAYGGAMALAQDDLRRLIAYSSMSQMGYLIVGVASVTVLGLSGSILQYLSHGLGKAILFLIAGNLLLRTGLRDMREMGGLAVRMPLSAAAFLIGCLTLAGIPPTIGFTSKWMLFIGVVEEGLSSPLHLAIAVSTILSTILTIAYGFWAMRRIFYGPIPKGLSDVEEAPPLMTAIVLLLGALSILMGIYPKPITEPLLRVIESAMGG
ncbi:hypothetical protein DRO24_00185 [Candidatus Bathyarchaeota archaeon]|nr:MAG: hypothetical protein DRO24_00185 [Candidatus Bathyarchaeota archaeon]